MGLAFFFFKQVFVMKNDQYCQGIILYKMKIGGAWKPTISSVFQIKDNSISIHLRKKDQEFLKIFFYFIMRGNMLYKQ